MFRLYTAVDSQQRQHVSSSGAVAAATQGPSGAATGFSEVLLFHLLQIVHHLQAFTDEPYLPLHVGHRALHPSHFPLQSSGNGPVVPLPGFILLPQLLVAVVLGLSAVGQHRPTAHLAGLAPVLAVAGVGVQVPAEELRPAALIRAGDELVKTAHAVAVLFRQWEGLCTATDLVLTLREGR